MHPRDIDRLHGWEFDGLLAQWNADDLAAAKTAEAARWSVTEVEN